MSLLFGAKSDCAKIDGIDNSNKMRIKLLAHLCEKVHVACDIIQAGERNYLGNLYKDFEQIASTIKEILDGSHYVTEEGICFSFSSLNSNRVCVYYGISLVYCFLFSEC